MALERLPVELLAHITTYITKAQTLARLSATCRVLYDFAQKEGWKVFTRTQFPSFPVSAHWKEAAHACTTLSKNWDRKAVIASYLDPPKVDVDLSAGRAGRWRPRGQTMGYQPAIDSYDECLGPTWSDRREVVAWSTGAGLALRISIRRSLTEGVQENSPLTKIKWRTYRPPGSVDGRDDITAVHLLRPLHTTHLSHHDSEGVILGTANGDVSLMRIPAINEADRITVRSRLATNGRAVRSADLSTSLLPLYAACLGDSTVALFPLTDQQKITPIDEVNITDTDHSCRVWSVSFISPDRLAVGRGPAAEPVHVYGLTPSGIERTPLKRLGAHHRDWRAPMQDTATLHHPNNSVYPIRSLPATSQAGHGSGDVFVSGGYDGIVRLHDLRSPRNFECEYLDDTFDMPVYSLAVLGRERLVAGRARHNLLTFWDLRVAGGRVYKYQAPGQPIPTPNTLAVDDKPEYPEIHSDCAVYLSPRNTQQSVHRNALRESPVYSLSAPSPSSPFLFAGVENKVLELNFSSVTDFHPDPIFGSSKTKSSLSLSDSSCSFAPRLAHLQKLWDPHNKFLNLAMYFRGSLYGQNPIEQTTLRGDMSELDSRWIRR